MSRLFPANDYYEELKMDEEIRELSNEEERRILEVFDEYIFSSIAYSNFSTAASLYILEADYVDSAKRKEILLKKAEILASMAERGTSHSSSTFTSLKGEINKIESEIEKKVNALLGEDDEEEDTLKEDFSEYYDDYDEDDEDEIDYEIDYEDEEDEEKKPKTFLRWIP